VEAVDVTLGAGPIQAYADVRRVARAWRSDGYRVLAYGASTGGSLAVRLAGENEVRAAVAVGAPTNLLTWGDAHLWRDLLGYTRAMRKAASPDRHIEERHAPLLLVHSRDDRRVPHAQSVALHRRYPGSRLRTRRRGGHDIVGVPLRGAIAWLLRHPRAAA
jgi:dipeptidyl aminopeptidase/acylaminoacyl peptidase